MRERLALAEAGAGENLSDGEVRARRAFRTRMLMHSVSGLAWQLLTIPTRKAIQLALLYFMQRLSHFPPSPTPPPGIRGSTPALFLRIDQELECYTFIRMWCVPFDPALFAYRLQSFQPNISRANAFEPYYILPGIFTNMAEAVTLTLLKIRVLCDLQSLQSCLRLNTTKLPREMIDMIRQRVVGSSVRRRPDIHRALDHTERMANLRQQVMELYLVVQDRCKHIWPRLLKEATAGDHGPACPANQLEQHGVLTNIYAAWFETPGALAIIQTLSHLDDACFDEVRRQMRERQRE